jgi:hypothetical protein
MKINFSAKGRGTAQSLSVSDFILLKRLLFKKTGGIHFVIG